MATECEEYSDVCKLIWRPYLDNKSISNGSPKPETIATDIHILGVDEIKNVIYSLWVHCIVYDVEKMEWKIYYNLGNRRYDFYQNESATTLINNADGHITLGGGDTKEEGQINWPPNTPLEDWPQNEYYYLNKEYEAGVENEISKSLLERKKLQRWDNKKSGAGVKGHDFKKMQLNKLFNNKDITWMNAQFWIHGEKLEDTLKEVIKDKNRNLPWRWPKAPRSVFAGGNFEEIKLNLKF